MPVRKVNHRDYSAFGDVAIGRKHLLLCYLAALFFRVLHSKIYQTKFERGEIQTRGCLVRSVNATSRDMNPHYLSSISANQNHLDVQTIVIG